MLYRVRNAEHKKVHIVESLEEVNGLNIISIKVYGNEFCSFHLCFVVGMRG